MDEHDLHRELEWTLADRLMGGERSTVALAHLPLLGIVMALAPGGVATLVADRWAFKLYLGAMLGPALAGILLVEQRRPENATLVLILAFAGFTWREHERAYGTLVQGLRTERRLRDRERQLSAAQARLHHVLASGNAIVYSVRVEGQTFIPDWVSDNLSRVLGYEVADALGAAWWLDHLHPGDRDQALARLSALFASDQFTQEYRFRHNDGQYRWVRDELHLVRDADGTPHEAVGVWLDVTEPKVAEENQLILLRELQSALAEVKTLRGMIKICATCKRVLTDEGSWQQFESHVHGHTDVEFSHGICPEYAAKWSADAG